MSRSRFDRRAVALSLLAVALVLFTPACGVKAELEECQSRLSALQGENGRLEEDLQALRTDYKEVLRGWGIAPTEESLTGDVMADVESRIEEVKTSIAEQVSPLVREQLEEKLGALVSSLDEQFGDLDARYTNISTQLTEVRGSLEVASQRLAGIEKTGTDIQTELVAQQVDEGRLEEELEKIAMSIEDFDETHFLCRDCEDYLSLKRKRQDVLVAFHADLRSALRRVPITVTRPDGAEPAADEPAAATEPATEDEAPAEGEATGSDEAEV